MDFKFFSGKQSELEPMQQLTLLGPRQHTNNEYCFQFDEDEPQIFAVSKETDLTPEVSIVLKNNSESHITFVDTKSGKQFKIFARPK